MEVAHGGGLHFSIDRREDNSFLVQTRKVMGAFDGRVLIGSQMTGHL